MTTSNNPYSSVSISGYNSSPPSDDGAITSSNKVQWAFHKTKLADPIKTLVESVNTNASSAFAKTINTATGVRNQVEGSIAFAWGTATIGTDILTPDTQYVLVGAESGATSDTLQSLATDNYYEGAFVFLRARNATEEIVLVHATSTAATATNPNIYLQPNANTTLDDTEKTVVLAYDSNTASGWVEVARSFLATDAVAQTNIQTDAVGSAQIAADAVTQSEIANSAVGQGELITTNGQVSTTGSTLLDLTLPGGAYGFYPQTWVSNGVKTTAANIASAVSSTSAVTNIALAISVAGGGDTARAQQTYVTASPPYDLGDGPIDGSFIFLIIDGLGNVVATYQAPDPPWAYNGPTNIRPTRRDPETGKAYRRIAGLDMAALQNDAAAMAALMAGTLDLQMREIEITPAFKNTDMPQVPHPFLSNDLTGLTVVMLDPMHRALAKFHEMQQAGEDVAGLFHSGRVKLDNTSLPRATPPGVMAVNFHL